jgi:hypothetical protein
MTNQTSPLKHWTVINVDEVTAQYPDHVDLDDGPFGWKNVHTDTVLHVEYDIDAEEWIVAGSNSVVGQAEDLPGVQSEAREYMHEHARPSSMVG